ncbi:MAG: LysR family transcriptional regulator [Burkholderiaceae bacterium]|nr:LysR family transcriptional regulator [Burkholderiaceae bacterium]
MNLRQLKQFVILAETRNFHKAAERLHMAQPPLSVSIRKLEDELGGALFLRTPSGVHLTPAGQAMLADARQALLHAEQCQQAVHAAQNGIGGLLRVGFIGTATCELLPCIIPGFRARYPRIDLELTEVTTQNALGALVERRLDVGLIRYPMLHGGPFEMTPLDEDQFMLAAPPDNPLARRARIALSAAAPEPFIMYEQARVPGLFSLAMMRCHQSGFAPRVVQEAMQVQTILSLVASRLGVALVAGVAKHYAQRGVRLLELTDTPRNFHIGIAAVTLRGSGSRLAHNFVEYAKETLQ